MQSLHRIITLGPYAGGLSNDGDKLELSDATGTRVEIVEYQAQSPWPTAPASESVSMELIHPSLDRQLGGSWRAGGPTPGARNSADSTNAPPQSRQVTHSPEQPTDSQATVVSVKVTDPNGVAAVQRQYGIILAGDYVPARLAKPHSQLEADPNGPPTPNPAYEADWITAAMLDDATNGDLLASDTTYAATIPAQPNRSLVRYRIVVQDSAGLSVRVPYADDPALNFAYFVYNGVPDYIAETRSVTGQVPSTHPKETLTTLPDYTLLTNQADYEQCVNADGNNYIDSLNSDARSATFVYNGKVYDNIGYRLRQRNGRYEGAGKRSFRFRFNDDHFIQLHDSNGNPYPPKWQSLNSHKPERGNRYKLKTGGNDGEQLKLSYGAGAPIRDFIYNHVAPWPDDPAIGGPSISRLDPSSLTVPNTGSNWIASSFAGGSPGGAEELTSPIWIFTRHNVSSPLAAHNADPAGDGFVNLLESALATNPDDANSVPIMASRILKDSGTAYFAEEYTERSNASDITFVPETSDGLASWSDDPGATDVWSSSNHIDDTRTIIRPQSPGPTASYASGWTEDDDYQPLLTKHDFKNRVTTIQLD